MSHYLHYRASMRQNSTIGNEKAMAYLHDRESLDSPGMGNVRTRTQVDERATTIYGRTSAVGNLLVDEMKLILAILEHFQQNILLQV